MSNKLPFVGRRTKDHFLSFRAYFFVRTIEAISVPSVPTKCTKQRESPVLAVYGKFSGPSTRPNQGDYRKKSEHATRDVIVGVLRWLF